MSAIERDRMIIVEYITDLNKSLMCADTFWKSNGGHEPLVDPIHSEMISFNDIKEGQIYLAWRRGYSVFVILESRTPKFYLVDARTELRELYRFITNMRENDKDALLSDILETAETYYQI